MSHNKIMRYMYMYDIQYVQKNECQLQRASAMWQHIKRKYGPNKTFPLCSKAIANDDMLLVCNGDDHYPVHSSLVRVLVLHHNFPLQLPSVTKSLAFGVPTILGLLNEMYQMPSIWMSLIHY